MFFSKSSATLLFSSWLFAAPAIIVIGEVVEQSRLEVTELAQKVGELPGNIFPEGELPEQFATRGAVL